MLENKPPLGSKLTVQQATSWQWIDSKTSHLLEVNWQYNKPPLGSELTVKQATSLQWIDSKTSHLLAVNWQ